MTDQVLDAAQLKRIEGVHRGFFYQHLWAAGCVLLMPESGADAVVTEHDEDVELALPDHHLYVQIKTRSALVQPNDVASALKRFDALREEHERGKRTKTAEFMIVLNQGPSPELAAAIARTGWPKDVLVRWPGDAHVDARVPPPWPGLPSGVEWCIRAAEAVPFRIPSAETLVFKLAAHAQYLATGFRAHRVLIEERSDLLEQLALQLHRLPAAPTPYHPQLDEPDLASDRRLRLLVGFSGAGKTAWAAEMALHHSEPVVYFDVGDLPGPAVASSLARDLAGRFLGAEPGGLAVVLSSGSGLELLRAINVRMKEKGYSALVVLDNAHHATADVLRSIADATPQLRFVFLAQPWEDQARMEAYLGAGAETLGGWTPDTIAALFSREGCRASPETCTGLRSLTEGMPLLVVNAAALTRQLYDGDGNAFYRDLAQQTMLKSTAHDAILGKVFDGLSTHAKNALALLGLAEVTFRRDEAVTLLRDGAHDVAPEDTVRELVDRTLVIPLTSGALKVHDAFRPLGRRYLQGQPEFAAKAPFAVRDVLSRSIEQGRHDLGRLAVWMRLLAETGEVMTLVDLATFEMFHEVGSPAELKATLEAVATSPETSHADRFWALEALGTWDTQDGDWEAFAARVKSQREAFEVGGLGELEAVALGLKEMIAAGRDHDRAKIDAVRAFLEPKVQGSPTREDVVRYMEALAWFYAGANEQVRTIVRPLVRDHLERLGIALDGVIGANTSRLAATIPDFRERQDELKHLADCFDLLARAEIRLGVQGAALWFLQAVKFYGLAMAVRSAVKVAQDAADELAAVGWFDDALSVLEQGALEPLKQVRDVHLSLKVRAQYAVILAHRGDVSAARAELERIDAYELDAEHRRELDNQKQLVERIARTPTPLAPPHTSLPRVGRNELCPCGSGLKYKKCHGR